MPPPLRRLLRSGGLGLTLLTAERELPAHAVDVPVQWVHSSDLADPTPFLSEGQVLLTTGTQFDDVGPSPADIDSPGSETSYAEYVARLAARGIAAVGFGTEVIRNGTPAPLVDACLRHGLPLFEVPYRTPFIAIARMAADLVAEESYARHTWALKAQRAISLAALRPDGLSATLSELSTQLDHWVALLDASGSLDRVFPPQALDDATVQVVRKEAMLLLRHGKRASASVACGDDTLTLQTLGGQHKLRGVLALGGTTELDQASRQVVTSVIALAGLALEQNDALDRAHGHLRSGLLHALLGGNVDLVANISREMWGELPTEPLRVALTDVPSGRLDSLTDHLELRVDAKPGTLFYAIRDDRLVLCLTSASADQLSDVCEAFGLHAGVSDPTTYAELPRALAQAQQGFERALEVSAGDASASIVEFQTISSQGVLAFLARTEAREVGRATLRPLMDHDMRNGTALLPSVRVWLEHNGQFDAAAQLLGVHRHTLRTRIAQAQRLLARDLSTFHARADVWAALLTLDSTNTGLR